MVDADATLDDAQLADGIARWLAQQHGVDGVVVDEVEHPSVGYSSVTTLLRARWTARPDRDRAPRRAHGARPRRHVRRLRPGRAARRAARGGGSPACRSRLRSSSRPIRSWLGAPFIVMPRVDGHIVGEAPPFDPWVRSLGTAGQAELHEQLPCDARADPCGRDCTSRSPAECRFATTRRSSTTGTSTSSGRPAVRPSPLSSTRSSGAGATSPPRTTVDPSAVLGRRPPRQRRVRRRPPAASRARLGHGGRSACPSTTSPGSRCSTPRCGLERPARRRVPRSRRTRSTATSS